MGDPRFLGCVCLDTWMFPLREEKSLFPTGSPSSKLLFINCEKFQEPPNLRTMQAYEGESGLGELSSNVVTLASAPHMACTDVTSVLEGSRAASLYKSLGGGRA